MTIKEKIIKLLDTEGFVIPLFCVTTMFTVLYLTWLIFVVVSFTDHYRAGEMHEIAKTYAIFYVPYSIFLITMLGWRVCNLIVAWIDDFQHGVKPIAILKPLFNYVGYEWEWSKYIHEQNSRSSMTEFPVIFVLPALLSMGIGLLYWIPGVVIGAMIVVEALFYIRSKKRERKQRINQV